MGKPYEPTSVKWGDRFLVSNKAQLIHLLHYFFTPFNFHVQFHINLQHFGVGKKMNHILNPVQPNFDSYCKWRIHPFTDLDCFSRDKFSTSLHASPSSRPSAPSGSPTSKPPIAPAAGMREVRRGGYPTWHLKMDSWKRRFLFETIISGIYV